MVCGFAVSLVLFCSVLGYGVMFVICVSDMAFQGQAPPIVPTTFSPNLFFSCILIRFDSILILIYAILFLLPNILYDPHDDMVET